MKIIVIGGLGFLGKHLVNLCLKKKYEVIIFDLKGKNSKNLKEINKEVKVFDCDISQFERLEKIKLENIDLVLHCASIPSAAKSFEEPLKDLNVNIVGTFNILKWCKQNKVKRIIYASTFNVYKEDPSINKYDELVSCEPKSMYAISKLTAENYIRVYGKHLGINWNIVRMFNIYGPGQDPDNKFAGMVSIFLNMAKKNSSISVKGSLERFRDFIYIEDVINAWSLLIENNKNYNKIYNLGTGTKCSVRNLLKEISLVLDKKLDIQEVVGTPGDFMGSVSEISKLKKDLGFKPNYDLKTGLKLFNDWLDHGKISAN